MNADLIGWASAFVLILTLGRQAYTQYRTRSIAGVSKWLFVGQLTASTGFTIYSWLLGNWVFVSVNFAILLTAVVGELIYLRNKRLQLQEQSASDLPDVNSGVDDKAGRQRGGHATRNAM